MRQSYDKNNADIEAVEWDNQKRKISGPKIKSFFKNILDSIAEGLLSNGTSIETAIKNLEANQRSGYIPRATFALLPTTGDSDTSYKVTNDPDTDKNGYYHWDTDSSSYVKDDNLVNGAIEEGNVDAVNGGEVYKNSAAVKARSVWSNVIEPSGNGYLSGTPEVFSRFIVGIEFMSDDYDPNYYYSPAIMKYTAASALSISVYKAIDGNGGSWTLFDTFSFTLTGDEDDNKIQTKTLSNGNSMSIIPSNYPYNGNVVGLAYNAIGFVRQQGEFYNDKITSIKNSLQIKSLQSKLDDSISLDGVDFEYAQTFMLDGLETANSSWRTTDYVRVNSGELSFNGSTIGGGYTLSFMSYYDKDFKYIGEYELPTSGLSFNNSTISIDEAVYYIRFSQHSTGTITVATTISGVLDRQLYRNLLVLPKYIDVAYGCEMNLYLDSIGTKFWHEGDISIKSTDSTNLLRRNRQLRFAPTGVVDNFTCRFTALNNGINATDTKNLTIRTVSNSVGDGTSERNILMIGDSLFGPGGVAMPTYVFGKLDADADFVFNRIGTVHGAEGRGGWAWNNFLGDGVVSPFVYNGIVDFQSYFADHFSGLSRQTIDYVIISLGTNDVSQGYTYATNSRLDTIIENAKTFINALLDVDTGYPNCKIAIGLPACGADHFPNSGASAEVFRNSIQRLNLKYINTFDDGAYHANVTTIGHGIWMDRYNSYQHEDVAISIQSTETFRVYTDPIHPIADMGYRQWGDAYYSKLRSFLAGNL